jgi:hypothetical protein
VVMIVTGILIAFVLDAWWNDQIEQREIRESLLSVHADFLSTKNELTFVITANRDYIEGVTTLISLLPGEIDSAESSKKVGLIKLLPTGGLTFDPVLGSLDAFISSGQINKVRNQKVRSLVGAWSGLMDEIGEDQNILIDMYMAQQERSVELGIYLMSANGDQDDVSPNIADDILKIVTGDTEMLNRLAAHSFAVRSLDEELEEIEVHLNRILQSLQEELGIK